MNSGFKRALAECTCRFLQAILPGSLRSWGRAIRHETDGIPDDTQALLFAVSSFVGLLPRVVAARLSKLVVFKFGEGPLRSGGLPLMNLVGAALRRPRGLAVACATGAVALGLAYMAIAGAPARYIGINACALGLGLVALNILDRTRHAERQWPGAAMAVAAAILLAIAILGDKAEGAARWVSLAGLSIQPSLILLPAMLVAFAKARDGVGTVSIIVAAVAMALQPDRAMAGSLALGLAVLAMIRPEKHFPVAFAASSIGFAVTLLRWDTLPAVAYVDQVFYTSFDAHPAAGAAVLGGSVLLLLPAIVGWRQDPAQRVVYAVFGAVWLAVLAAAALGNYPTPLVGYGGSAIIGYALSLLALPKHVEPCVSSVKPATSAGDESSLDLRPFVAGAQATPG